MSAVARLHWLGLGLVAIVVTLVLDQFSKWWVMTQLLGEPFRFLDVTGFLRIVWVWNRGVSFGLFGGAGIPPIGFAAFAAVIVMVLAVWMWRCGDRFLATALGLVIGGAIGNVIDRLRFGAVFDFIDVYVGRYHWPAFNVADAAITVGVLLLAIDALLRKPGENG